MIYDVLLISRIPFHFHPMHYTGELPHGSTENRPVGGTRRETTWNVHPSALWRSQISSSVASAHERAVHITSYFYRFTISHKASPIRFLPQATSCSLDARAPLPTRCHKWAVGNLASTAASLHMMKASIHPPLICAPISCRRRIIEMTHYSGRSGLRPRCMRLLTFRLSSCVVGAYIFPRSRELFMNYVDLPSIGMDTSYTTRTALLLWTELGRIDVSFHEDD